MTEKNMSAERIPPAPERNAETSAYWSAAEEGKLLVKYCNACGQYHAYPRSLCPFCFSDQTEWRTASGKGTLYSYSVMRRAPVPYAIAYVTLEEGPSMMTNIVDADFDALRCGQSVTLVFKPAEGGTPVPMFAPA